MPQKIPSPAIRPPNIGILGGLGPYGHIALETTLMRERQALSRSPLPDQKFPTWIVLSQSSTPDRTRCIEAGKDDCKNQILSGLKFLLSLNPRHIVIPCVTAHHWAPEFEAACQGKFENIVTHTLAALARRGISRLAILGTVGTVRASIFSAHAERLGHNIEIVFPKTKADISCSHRLIGNAIDKIKAAGAVDEHELRPLVRMAQKKEPEAIILGCTELSYVAANMRALFADWLVVDPLQVTAKALLANSLK